MKDYYYELKIIPKDNIETFLDVLTSICDEAIEEGKDYLIARSEVNLEDIEFGIQEFAKAMKIKCETILTKKKNEDWIKQYQESVEAIEVGKFYVRPSWKESKDGLIDIIINPALSFGSGHHETTNACLEAISKYVKKDINIIDVGTGSGILAIAASKLEANVDICDTDEVCIKDSEVNFSLNNTTYNNSWVGSATKANKKYDIVIANIVADVLVFIANDLKKCLNNEGILIISGILDKHLPKVMKKFKDIEELELIRKNEWCTVVLKNK